MLLEVAKSILLILSALFHILIRSDEHYPAALVLPPGLHWRADSLEWSQRAAALAAVNS
jgi:hypothetical protein